VITLVRREFTAGSFFLRFHILKADWRSVLLMLCRHEELLSADDGVYAAMWTQQQTKLAEEEQRRKMSETDVMDSAVSADTIDSLGRRH